MTDDVIWGEQGVLAFPVDCDAVLKQLKQDMRDDWFFDALFYKDIYANKADLKKVITDLLCEGNGEYVGDYRQIYDVPKKGFGTRYSLETDFYDRFIYQSICTYLINYFDPLLSHRVLGHRLNKKRRNERYLFKNRIELWRTFEGVTHTAFANEQALLVTDLINYFENITVDLVRNSFLEKLSQIEANGKEKLRIRSAVDTLCNLLRRWGYSDRHGLPQNRDASSFIANVVLSNVDEKMAKMGYDYYRYVDDIRIICRDERHARKALTDLIAELRTVGMNINSAKTAILTSATESNSLAEFFPATDDRSVAIDNMWKSRSRRVIARSVPLIYELLKETIESRQTQSRQFRFAVNRIKILIEADLFDVESDLAGALTDLIIDSFETQAASTDQFCRILSIIELSDIALERIATYLQDHAKAIHPWQNYHLWMLLAKKKKSLDVLIDIAIQRLNQDVMAPEIPAIFIYLKSVGNEDALIPVIKEYRADWPYQHQRYFLFSVKDLDKDLLKPIVDLLGTKVRGTVKRATNHFPDDGSLVGLPERTDILNIYEHISPYD